MRLQDGYSHTHRMKRVLRIVASLLAVIIAGLAAFVVLTPAGATHPYGKDPEDRTIRIAPTFPTLKEVGEAAEGVALCVLLASTAVAV